MRILTRGSARRVLRGLLKVETAVAAALLATAIAIWQQDALTTRSLRFAPADWARSYYTYVYGDESDGGTSTASERKPLDWACTLTRAYSYRYCGFGLLFDLNNQGQTLDLTSVETVRIKLRYEGRAEFLRMTLKDRDPRFKNPDGSVADKINQTTVTVQPGEQTITLQLDDFTVAEWWKAQFNATGEIARPTFDRVLAAEFITGLDAWPGEHRIVVRELVFERRIVSSKTWYGGIVALWLCLSTWFLLQRRRQAQRLRNELRQRLKTTLDTIPQMVWSLDEHGRSYFNQRWAQFTGVVLTEDRAKDFWSLVHPEERQRARDEWLRCLATADPYEQEFRLKHVSGAYRWVLARAAPAQDEDGAPAGFHGTCTDVHDRVLAQHALRDSIASERRNAEQLKWTSEHDALTGLPNRRAFQTKLAASTLKAAEIGQQLGLLLLDMDHFKHTNDNLGHWAGDELLKAIASRLQGALREGDFVARIGGDEFAIILEPIRSREELSELGAGIVARIRPPVEVDGRTINPTASIGGAIFSEDADTANDLFKAADSALYALKRSGRGGLRLFHPEMLEDTRRVASQLGRARKAINEDRLLAVYQPKVALSTGSIVGFEALLRWDHPTRGIQLPVSLEEAFRDYELAARLGELMQRQVAADLRGWLDEGLETGRISINASPAEFLRDDYAERLGSILREYGLPGSAIEVEITEQSFIGRSQDKVARALLQLRDLGVTIALDDFGTGYSSLSHLRDFPVDLVKIDQSFVQQMVQDRGISSIVTAVVNLASSLGLTVVAEGVELPEQREMLQAMGCQFAQGYLFSLPIPAAELPQLLAFRRAA